MTFVWGKKGAPQLLLLVFIWCKRTFFQNYIFWKKFLPWNANCNITCFVSKITKNPHRFGLYYAINSDVSNTIVSNIERTPTSFFKHRTNLKVFIYWLAWNDRTSNFEPNKAINRFTKLLIEQTRTLFFFWTLNELKCVHLLVI